MPLKRLVASLVRWWLYVIASGTADFSLAGGFASNGYAEHSPGALQSAGQLHRGSGDDIRISLRHLRIDEWAGTEGLRPPSDRVLPDVDSSGQYYGYEHVSEPGKKHWLVWVAPIVGALAAGAVYRWLGRDEADVVGEPEVKGAKASR